MGTLKSGSLECSTAHARAAEKLKDAKRSVDGEKKESSSGKAAVREDS
jgi:hypothetical protein